MVFPLIGAAAAVALAGYSIFRDKPTVQQQTPSIEFPTGGGSVQVGLNLTAIAGYLVLGGLVYYFGKRLIS